MSAEARKWPRSIRSSADERYDAAMALRAAFVAFGGGGPTYDLAELLEHQADALARYADCLLKARAAYHAPDDWLGPIGFVLSDEDQDALVERVAKYKTAIVHAVFRHQE